VAGCFGQAESAAVPNGIKLVLFDMDNVLCDYDRGKRVACLAQLAGSTSAFVHKAIWETGFELLGDSGALDASDYLRGFGYQGAASREGWQRSVAEMSIGAGLKEGLTEPGQWTMGITGFGELLPYHENRIMLDKEKKDKWGLPVLSMDAEIKDNEKKMRKDMVSEAVEMLEAAGLKNVHSWDRGHPVGDGIHEMGAARMGRDAKTSVLNGHNQVWDAPNVFVTDGASMTSSACQNPSLTYMALTARAADFAVSELKKGNI